MNPPRFRRSASHAFSLMELMISIVILVVVVAIAFPVLGAVRKQGGATTCAANLRQIALAALAQCTDRQGLLPDMGVYNSIKPGDAGLSLLPYMNYPLKNEGYLQPTVFTCPVSWAHSPTKTATYRTYAINRYATSSRINQPDDFEKIRDSVAIRLQNVAQPPRMAFFMDGQPRGSDPASTYYIDQNYARIDPEKTPFLHGKAIYVAFLDGHVEVLTQARAEAELMARASITDPFWGAIR